VQETDIVTLVSSITKYAVCVKDPLAIRYELEKAVHIARSGRPGPVWLDICLDVQSKDIEPSELKNFRVYDNGGTLVASEAQVTECIAMLKAARRPVLVVGYGVRLAGADQRLRELVDVLKIPVITSWTASDMLESPYHIGHIGIFGDRAANFTVQKRRFPAGDRLAAVDPHDRLRWQGIRAARQDCDGGRGPCGDMQAVDAR